jgi:hypothetical protein
MLLAVRAIKSMNMLPDLDTQSRFGHPSVAHKQNHLEVEHARVARNEVSNKTALIPGPSEEALPAAWSVSSVVGSVFDSSVIRLLDTLRSTVWTRAHTLVVVGFTNQ